MSDGFLTVTELNEYIKMMMEGNPLLNNLYVRGEISNFTNHYKTGHFYFSLKDETGTLRAVMFRSYAQRLRFMPESGMKVILHGRVTVFPRDGQYQIYVDDMQPDGVGALAVAYEQLRRKLEAEGLFDASRKRPIPSCPESVGLITSPTGAAVQDMIHILGRRFPAARVILYPALVQGAGAPESLAAGVRFFNECCPTDVLIIGRGGGSAEDLWGFNNEMLARTVAASEIPIISAVGHETDVTICDFAADLRAPTPSAAAELAVPDRGELLLQLSAAQNRLLINQKRIVENKRAAVSTLSGVGVLRSPRNYLEDRRMQLIQLSASLGNSADRRLADAKSAFATSCAKMEMLNPLRVLSRGYAAVFDEGGRAVAHGAALSAGDRIGIRFADKTADATVIGVRESE